MLDNIAVISGAGSGIGRALALELGCSGYHLFLIGRTEEKLTDTAATVRSLGGSVYQQLSVDLSQEKEIEHIGTLLGKNRVSVLVHCAGDYQKDSDNSDEQIELKARLHRNNVETAVNLNKELKTKLTDSAHIIFINSIAAIRDIPGISAYADSKKKLREFSKSTREELMGTGIKVSSVYPGGVETPSWSDEEKQGIRLIAPYDIGRVVYYILSSRANIDELVVTHP